MSKFAAFFLLLLISIATFDTVVSASGNKNPILDPVLASGSGTRIPKWLLKLLPKPNSGKRTPTDVCGVQCRSLCLKKLKASQYAQYLQPCTAFCQKCCRNNWKCPS